MKDYKWNTPQLSDQPLVEGAVCSVEGIFDFIFEWSDKIIDEVNEDGTVSSYKGGWLIKPIPRTYVYNNQPYKKLYTTKKS